MALTNNGNIIIRNGTTTREIEVASLQISYNSIATEDSGRNDNGVMVVDYLRSNIAKLQITLPPCANLSTVLPLVQGQTYYITYYDALSGSEKTIHCYTSEASVSLYSGVINGGFWNSCSFNAIEL